MATAEFPVRSLPKRAHLPYYLAALFLLAVGAQAQPTNVSVSPASGSSAAGVAQAFTATYADSLGAGYIADTYFLVNSTDTSIASACYVEWFGATGGLYLVNDAATLWLGPLTPGSSGTLQNSQCTLYGTGSSVTVSGTQVTMTLNLSFTTAFAGTKGTYMLALDTQGYYSALQQMGSWTVTATGYPDLTIAKSHSGNFTQGQTGAYTITATNSGSGVTSGTVTVTDGLPSGLTASTLTGSGWNCTVLTLTCTRSDALAVGSSYPVITLTVNVDSNAPSSLNNQVTIAGGGEINTSNDTATDATTINSSGGGSGDLALGKAAAQSSTLSGTTAVAGLAVDGNTDGQYYDGSVSSTNNDQNAWWQVDLGSSATVNSVVVWNRTDCCNPPRLVDYWVFVSNTPFLTTDTPTTLQGRTGTWSNHQTTAPSPSTTVSPGGYSGRYVRVQLTGQNYLSLAEVQVFGSAGASTPDLTITKSHSGSFTQGQTGAYTITATNSGTAATSGLVTMTDSPPSGLTASALSGSGWSCTVSTVTCTRSDALAAGSSYPAITLTVNVAASAPSSVTNTATVSRGGETNINNDSASDVTTIVCTCGTLGTMASPTPGSTLPGSSVTFTWNQASVPTYYILWVGTTQGSSNLGAFGPFDATGLPPGNNISQTVTGLPVDGTTVYVRLYTYLSGAWLPNDYTYAAHNGGGGTPNLVITKSHTGNFTLGQIGAAYTLTATNNGTGPTSGTTTVTDTLPSGLTANSISGSGWNCTLSPLSCSRSDALAAGYSYPIAPTVNVASNAPASVTNGASVTGGGSTTDPTTTCGTGTTATMSTPAPGSTLSGSTVTLIWNCVAPALYYYLYVGTTGVDSSDLINQIEYGTSQMVSNVPASGFLYVRLWTYTSLSGWLSIDYTYPIGAATVPITVTSTPITGLSVTVDGTAHLTPYTFASTPGSSHTIGAAAQNGATGTQYVLPTWSDGGAASSHQVAPASATTYTVSFTTQYFLTTSVNPAGSGTITPATGWQNAGGVTVTATANTGDQFSYFSGALTGTTPSGSFTMTAPASVTATFSTIGSFTIEVLDSTMRTVTSGAPMYVSRPASSPVPYYFTIRATSINGFSGTINFNEYMGFPGNVSTTGISPIALNGSGQVLGSFPIIVYANAALGPATITFNAFGNNESLASIPAYLNVTSGPLSATCSASPSPAAIGQSATFSASPSGGTPPYTYSWSGAVSGSGPQIQFTELTAGTFTDNLTVMDNAGQQTTASCSATVNSNTVITSVPAGLPLTVDGTTCRAPCSLPWSSPIGHVIAVEGSPQPTGATSTQYLFASWSDNGSLSHSISQTASMYTAIFTPQYFLNTAASAGGSISGGGWYNASASAYVVATPNSGSQFTGFLGDTVGTAGSVTMNGPKIVIANFVSGATGLALSANTATPLVLANAQPVQVLYSFSQGDSTGLSCTTSDANVSAQVLSASGVSALIQYTALAATANQDVDVNCTCPGGPVKAPIHVSPAPVINSVTGADGNTPILMAGVPGTIRIYGQNFGTVAGNLGFCPAGASPCTFPPALCDGPPSGAGCGTWSFNTWQDNFIDAQVTLPPDAGTDLNWDVFVISDLWISGAAAANPSTGEFEVEAGPSLVVTSNGQTLQQGATVYLDATPSMPVIQVTVPNSRPGDTVTYNNQTTFTQTPPQQNLWVDSGSGSRPSV